MKAKAVLVLLAVLAIASLFGAPLVGIEKTPLGALWGDAAPGELDIFWTLRMPRVAVAFLAGAGLAVAGMAFQAMFRNPLATPFTLGVSSGASLGAAISIHLGLAFSVLRIPGESWFAFAGSLVTVAVVYGLARAARSGSNHHDVVGRRGRELLLLEHDPVSAIHQRPDPDPSAWSAG